MTPQAIHMPIEGTLTTKATSRLENRAESPRERSWKSETD
jgi:hypothetical protein